MRLYSGLHDLLKVVCLHNSLANGKQFRSYHRYHEVLTLKVLSGSLAADLKLLCSGLCSAFLLSNL